ncbi:hypothetical protein HGRIS_006910 [Hohenbuehelia grisea]|uniref:Uncharacterized protein n=1 Tax=Hohenbuehelia grisea TaxID=104357 RepID=A0ABR3JB04_9AGAR
MLKDPFSLKQSNLTWSEDSKGRGSGKGLIDLGEKPRKAHTYGPPERWCGDKAILTTRGENTKEAPRVPLLDTLGRTRWTWKPSTTGSRAHARDRFRHAVHLIRRRPYKLLLDALTKLL